jgi:hypothetical protein
MEQEIRLGFENFGISGGKGLNTLCTPLPTRL